MKKLIIFTLILTLFAGIGVFAEERYKEFNTADLRLRMHTNAHYYSNVHNIATLYFAQLPRYQVIDETATFLGQAAPINILYLDTTANPASYAYLLYALKTSTKIGVRYDTAKRPGSPWNDKTAAEITTIEIVE